MYRLITFSFFFSTLMSVFACAPDFSDKDESPKRQTASLSPAAKRQRLLIEEPKTVELLQTTPFKSVLLEALDFFSGKPSGLSETAAKQTLAIAKTGQGLTSEVHNEILFFLAEMRCNQNTNAITDEEAAGYFERLRHNRNFNALKEYAPTYNLALMRYYDRTDIITLEGAAELFAGLMRTQYALQLTKSLSKFRLAVMRMNNKTSKIKDDDAAKYFDELRLIEFVPQAIKDTSIFNLAMMRLAERTSRITDSKACQYLEKILKNSDLDDALKDQARQAISVLNKRISPQPNAALQSVEEILKAPQPDGLQRPISTLFIGMEELPILPSIRVTPDEAKEASKLLSSINSPNSQTNDVLSSKYQLAEMRFQNKTDLIDDTQAEEYLLEILREYELSLHFRTNIKYYLACMQATNRTDKSSDITAIKYFTTFIQRKSISQSIQDHSYYYLALMRLQNRTDRVTDEEAKQYFQLTINSPNIHGSLKIEAQKGLSQLIERLPAKAFTPPPTIPASMFSNQTFFPQPVIQSFLPPISTVSPIAPQAAPLSQQAFPVDLPVNLDHIATELLKLRKSDHVTKTQARNATFELARMRSLNQTTLINDEKARKFLGGIISQTQDKTEFAKALSLLDIFLNRMK